MENFEQAIQWIRERKKIRRASWNHNRYLYLDDSKQTSVMRNHKGKSKTISPELLLADDWEIFKETEKEKCSFAGCDNPASICFTCHGEECVNNFKRWKEDLIKELKEN